MVTHIRDNYHGLQGIILEFKSWLSYLHLNSKGSRLIWINSKKTWDKKEPYVYPNHYNEVFFYTYVLDRDWWFVLRHDPTSKHLFENNSVIMPSEEDNLGDGNE